MRVLQGQVHVLELVGLMVACVFGYAIGYSLPLLAAMVMLLWPLMILQAIGEGLIWGLFIGLSAIIGWLWRGGKPKPPEPEPELEPEPHEPRTGVAGYLWYLPLVAVSVGYIVQYFETGTWFL